MSAGSHFLECNICLKQLFDKNNTTKSGQQPAGYKRFRKHQHHSFIQNFEMDGRGGGVIIIRKRGIKIKSKQNNKPKEDLQRCGRS